MDALSTYLSDRAKQTSKRIKIELSWLSKRIFKKDKLLLLSIAIYLMIKFESSVSINNNNNKNNSGSYNKKLG